MNKLLTLTLIFISISAACLGQSPKKEAKNDTYLVSEISIDGKEQISRKITFSKGEALSEKEYRDYVLQTNPIIRQRHQRDSSRFNFLRVLIQAEGIDLSRVSPHPDSLKITDKEILLILKPKKK